MQTKIPIRNKDLVTACAKLVTDDPIKREFFKRALYANKYRASWFLIQITREQFDAKLHSFEEILPQLKKWFAEKCQRSREQLMAIEDKMERGIL